MFTEEDIEERALDVSIRIYRDNEWMDQVFDEFINEIKTGEAEQKMIDTIYEFAISWKAKIIAKEELKDLEKSVSIP